MLQRVEEYVARWGMLKKEDRIIVGVSGGADSICLLFVLMELQEKIPFDLIVVHINHNLRGKDADADETYVRSICERYGIPLEVYSEDVELIAKNRKQSTEEAGRELRREAFQKAMKTYGATKIALAHHKNDSVETFFLNLARGTGLKGLGGIRPVAGDYIRPLLCVERKEIEQYLQIRGVDYCVDATNAKDDYTRNRIRNHVIPYMEREINAKTISHITQTMAQLQEIQSYLEEQKKHYFEMVVKEEEDGYFVPSEEFAQIPSVLKPLILKEILVRISGKEKDLEKVHLKELLQLFEKQVGRQLDLPYGMMGKRVYEGIRLSRKKENVVQPVCYELDFSKGNVQEFWWNGRQITCSLFERNAKEVKGKQKSNTEWFDYDIISDKIYIRTRQAGDYITLYPDGRSQKIKSFFINHKIPQERREEILLAADGHHILWILGMQTNCMYQVREHTKRILEIRINEGESYERDSQSINFRTGRGCKN